MATIRFKGSSPYVQNRPDCDSSDFLYQIYEDNVRLNSSHSTTDKVINFAIFGLGRIGSIHLSNIASNPRIKVLYIVDDTHASFDELKRHWRLTVTECIRSVEADKVFQDPRVDVVLVASPTFTHEDIVKKSLSHGKAVFCEKPVAQDIESSERCYTQANKTGKTLFTAFNRRFDPAYCQVRDRVRKGEVGHVQMVKICSRDSPLPSVEYLSTSGGIFHDCAVHDIDVMCWTLGEYPIQVSTIAYSHIPEIAKMNDYDTVAITLKFPSGTMGIIDISRYSCYGYDMRFEVFGPGGMISCGNERPMQAVESMLSMSGSRYNPIYYSFPSRFKLAYYYEMEHFLDVFEGKAETRVPGSETLAIIKIATACEESAKSGKVINLTWASGDTPK